MRYADKYCNIEKEDGYYVIKGLWHNTMKENIVKVKQEDLYKYRQGALIQDAFSNLSPRNREFLLTGMDFNELYKKEK